jgi:subtilisin family serine protease
MHSLGVHAGASAIGGALPKRAAELLTGSSIKKLLSSEVVQEICPLFRGTREQNHKRSLTSLVETVHEENASELSGYNLLRFTSARSAQRAMKLLQADEMIETGSVHASAKRHYYAAAQWSLDSMRVPEAERDKNNGLVFRAIPIAVIDGGVDETHEDFKGVSLTAKTLLTGPFPREDTDGHGTHCAGIVAAESLNNLGIRGVCRPEALYCLKAFNPFDAAAYYDAIEFAFRQMRRGVISLSIGGLGADPLERTLLQQAVNNGCVVVTAMGNRGVATPEYPAAYSREIDGVIAVGAHKDNDEVWPLSNTGPHLDLLAPGVDIMSTVPERLRPGDPYAPNTGTSMAVPHVAAAAAILMKKRPSMTPKEVRDRLCEKARKIAGDQPKIHGFGRLDLKNSL